MFEGSPEKVNKKNINKKAAQVLGSLISATVPAADTRNIPLVEQHGPATAGSRGTHELENMRDTERKAFAERIKKRIGQQVESSGKEEIDAINKIYDEHHVKFNEYMDARIDVLKRGDQDAALRQELSRDTTPTSPDDFVERHLHVQSFLEMMLRIELNFQQIKNLRPKENDTRSYLEMYGESLLDYTQRNLALLSEILKEKGKDPEAFERAVIRSDAFFNDTDIRIEIMPASPAVESESDDSG